MTSGTYPAGATSIMQAMADGGSIFPAWDEAATRAWVARALWVALSGYWPVDRLP